jgi:hypothetical protein
MANAEEWFCRKVRPADQLTHGWQAGNFLVQHIIYFIFPVLVDSDVEMQLPLLRFP